MTFGAEVRELRQAKRVCQRPEVFTVLAELADVDLEAVFKQVMTKPKKAKS